MKKIAIESKFEELQSEKIRNYILEENHNQVFFDNKKFTFYNFNPKLIVGFKQTNQIELLNIYIDKNQFTNNAMVENIGIPDFVLKKGKSSEKNGEFTNWEITTYANKEKFNNHKFEQIEVFEWERNNMKISAREEFETKSFIVFTIRKKLPTTTKFSLDA